MAHDGTSFYDDDELLARYSAQRARADNPNDTLEAPIIDELIGDVRGLRILDLGCGAGAFGRALLARGAARYVGVEGAGKMAAAARAALAAPAASGSGSGSGQVEVIEARIESWPMPKAAFDRVVSRLVLHYLDDQDLGRVLAAAAAALVPGGRVVLSVEHPVITSCARSLSSGQPREDWLVDDYFVRGARDTAWLGGHIRKHHRTVEDYFAAIQRAGFTIDSLRESCPRRDLFADDATYARRLRIPLFLLISGRR